MKEDLAGLYVRVGWPESQRWQYEDGCFTAMIDDELGDDADVVVFVPIEMYNAKK